MTTTNVSRPFRLWRYALVALAVAAAFAAGIYWLLASERGLQAAVMLAESLSGGRLKINQSEGRLLGPLKIGELKWTDGADHVVAEHLSYELQADELLAGRAHFTHVSVQQLALDLAPSSEPPSLPETLRLPFDLRIDRAELGELRRNGHVLATAISATLTSEGGRHRVDDLHADIDGLAVGAHGTIGTEAPFTLDAVGRLQGKLEDHPLRLEARARGQLAAIDLTLASGTPSLRGSAQATITPFADLPISRLQVDLAGLDPAAWRAAAPSAALDLAADLHTTDKNALAGQFSLRNRAPGPLDRQRLPIVALSGRVDWHAGRVALSKLDAALAGGGRLRGNGSWQANELALDLQAEAVDAAALHSALRRSRLAGPVRLRLGEAKQSARIDLADAHYALKATLTRAGDTLRADDVLARAGDAMLKADGEATLDGQARFSVHGQLVRFDPARFVDLPYLPAARINAEIEAQGRWRPALRITGHFALKDSRLAQRPLAGRGEADIDGTRVRKLDLHLTAGANRLDARGAFGADGEALTLTVAAPELGAYGLDGGISGSLRFSGTAAAPIFDVRATTRHFGVPGHVALDGLNLDASAGDTGPVRLRLRLAAAGTPDRPQAVKDLTASVDGTRGDHRLSVSAQLADGGRLSLAAHGGLTAGTHSPAWRGELTALDLRGGRRVAAFHLSSPTPLRLAADGWTLGPAQLAGDDWQARLHAHADQRRLDIALEASGPQLGHLTANLAAGADGPWRLAMTAPWRAGLDVDSPDVSWLAPLIGDDAATAGRARIELQVAGTPARPLASGRLNGEALALRLPEFGLRLDNGRLDATLNDNRLHVTQLAFDSPLTPPPRALVLAEGDAVTALTTRPGRVEAAGEVAVDTGQLFLDVKFDRLGIAPGPDRWAVVSGNGRLDWRDGRLGLTAQVTADAGYWQLPRLDAPRLGEDVTVKRHSETQAPAQARSPLALDIEASLGRHLRFSGAGLNARLAGKLRLTAAGHDLPRAAGTIRAEDGRFDAYGQELHIERGILTFSGLLDNPALDVLAVRRGLPVTPGVEVTGTVRRPQVRLYSDPELPDAEKLSWLVLGRPPDQAGSGDASTLLAAAGSLLGGESGGVVQQLKRNFGIEELGVRTGQLADTGRAESSQVVGGGIDNSTGSQIFTVGKRLSANTLLTYEQALGTTESLVKLTLSLSKRLSLVGRAGADNGIDLFYTFTFGR
jgi:translocation and assembly module TamB